ncbi:MAG: hypothetical protein L0I48_03960 [Lactococcus plantarum]|nr:hypothetical protein [Lactococcus plantarum]MDN6084820.1 hypothetical protein [Lactococcus plantarum]
MLREASMVKGHYLISSVGMISSYSPSKVTIDNAEEDERYNERFKSAQKSTMNLFIVLFV